MEPFQIVYFVFHYLCSPGGVKLLVLKSMATTCSVWACSVAINLPPAQMRRSDGVNDLGFLQVKMSSTFPLSLTGDFPFQVVRIFSAPRQFMETFQELCGVQETGQVARNF